MATDGMKVCAICGRECAVGAETCPFCGEATWAPEPRSLRSQEPQRPDQGKRKR